MLAASGDCIKVLDVEGRILFVNESGHEKLEAFEPANLLSTLWTAFWPDEPAALAALVEARAGRDSRFAGAAPTLRGNDRQWDVRITPVRSAAAGVTQILVISRDITEQHRLEVQKALLASELEHRVKNMLAVVVAIAQQTLRAPASLAEASCSFTGRVQALSRAQSLLTRTSWESADIRPVIDEALAPHRIAGDSRQFQIGGPHLDLTAKRALALALALHELATNAAKYGSLSVPDGTVQLLWHVVGKQLQIEWREVGGPAVSRPTRAGFGSRLLERVLASDFEGEVRIEFATSGVTCVLTAPL